MSEAFFTYKNRPLVRNKNVVYYGRMSDPYVVMMQIHSTKKYIMLKFWWCSVKRNN